MTGPATVLHRVCDAIEGLADPYGGPFPPPEPRIWPYLLTNLARLRRVLAVSLAFTILAAAIEVWLIGYAGRLIDTLAEVPPAELWSRHGWEFAGVAALLLVLRPLSHFAREGTNDLGLKPNAATLFRWRAARHVGAQSVGWFQSDLAGRTATRVVEIGTDAAGAIYGAANALAYVGVYLIGIVLLMAASDPRLALPLLVWLAIYAVVMRALIPRFDRANESFHATRSAMQGALVDSYANIDTVKLFASDGESERDTRQHIEATRQAFFGLQRVEVAINIAVTVLEGAIMVGLVGYALLLWQTGAASLGVVAAALALTFKITSMVEWLMDAVASIFGHVGSLREALRTVAQPLAIADRPDAAPLRVSRGAIALHRVSHHYGTGAGGLREVSLQVAPGERIGLVGPSGAGKSTLVNLLLRFHDPEQGRIEIDGQDIRTVTQESLRASIGTVAQQAALLHRSVRDNIAFGQGAVDDAAIVAAATAARAQDFIPGLRDAAGRTGHDAHVGERGVKLSGGQRQRIALARVFLKDAPILVLDEATSALDSEVEAAIQDSISDLMQGKTVIAIAHRLATIAAMDRIVVMEAGRIVEDGTHADLLARGGLYARLWARQSGGFLGQAAE